MTVIVTMATGETYSLAGYASRVAAKVNVARGLGRLLDLEQDSIPTGQMIHLDPDLVMSIRDDR